MPSKEFATAIPWLKRNTLDLSDVEQSEILRGVLDGLATKRMESERRPRRSPGGEPRCMAHCSTRSNWI
ncbi:hypothetical protein [Kribbella pratensis]|uniref:hypothetical protein n=1 Tax=Kribbella pratensis TaxID=2512112 RepID=UPI0014170F76|nr:hypothetical protein [Kribbella pratensis]